MSSAKQNLKARITVSLIILFSIIFISSIFLTVKSYAQHSETPAAPVSTQEQSTNVKAYGLMAAALAFGLGTVGAGIAIANVGSAAMGAVAEKPEIAGQALIFVALAEGLVVFSFITALMILGKV